MIQQKCNNTVQTSYIRDACATKCTTTYATPCTNIHTFTTPAKIKSSQYSYM